MQRTFILLAAFFGFTGVALGAFGAHGLQSVFAANGRADTFHTATQYEMIHALALLAAAWLIERCPGRLMRWAGWLFAAGIVLFSGSLYILAIFDASIMGALAPLGGLALLGGWLSLGWAARSIS